ncbi:hypothetical protein E2562_012077 [Oryza meyeriana var. granulata]|uniref:Uncharacterized protein n=1 Tax=Oryza meyeriana var. granulata TaxID=110450 RepID=A0A6G1F737_9ORYZ|nr:hypothetical protein E2562_012077 [Oryza meyeriana var. granulata]
MLHKWKVAEGCGGGGGGGGGGGDQRRRCVTASLSMLIAATLAFLAYVAFFPYDGAGGLYRWWRCEGCGGEAGGFAFDEAAMAQGPTPGGAGRRAPTTLSHIVFGIGASARTWDKRRGYAELWWRPGEMRGHVWLDEQPVGPWPAATCPPYRISADASRFGDRASASRMARIVADSFLAITAEMANGTTDSPEARWFVMGDDDTLFFPDNLVAVLNKYDHEEMYYVGAPSESVEQNVMHSYGMAFGGGGFAVSYPAAAELAKAIDGCLDRYSLFYGSDQRVQACLSELGIPLTRERGFHQVDIRGDAYGMLAAHPVAPLVSLHHLDHIEPISPGGGSPLDAVRQLVGASRLDPARSLQQAFCYQRGPRYTWSVSVAWGYTVQLYPWTLAPHELEVPLRTFKTWRSWADGPFVFNTRPLRHDDACAQPAVFFLSGARNETSSRGRARATVTEYARRAAKPGAKECDRPSFLAASTVRTVRVFAPKMSPNEWTRVRKTS